MLIGEQQIIYYYYFFTGYFIEIRKMCVSKCLGKIIFHFQRE